MNNIFIVGAGGHAKAIVDIIEKNNQYKISGFVDDSYQVGDTFFGYPVIGHTQNLEEIMNKNRGCFVAIGDNWIRSKIVERIKKINPAYNFVTLIHPLASMGRDVETGEGSVIMANVHIKSDSNIGNHCLVNTGSCLGHDVKLEDYSSFGPGTIVGGNVNIGEFSAIGLGANIIHQINIGRHTVIG
ncbi:MAG: NeuD/PglB/VioB family sugar acetyltransferase, partial [Vulcanimicrobiota bacterium]